MTRFLYVLMFMTGYLAAQNEQTKWIFGRQAGLDFMTSPPTSITHTTLHTYEGSASIADAAGNLLLYTDGITVWNGLFQVMPNGTGLMGNGSTVQSALIVKQPGSNTIYFVFTLDAQGLPNGLRYSSVDLSLAGGTGSVTTKNVPIMAPCTEQLAGARHCNGTDVWVVTHALNSNSFYSFLVTAAGVSTVPVISSVGPVPPTYIPNNTLYGQGTIKICGKKLGLTYFNGSANNEVALFDFDRNSGVVSNYLSLRTSTLNAVGCEFSPDGSKFYTAVTQGTYVVQWDLSAGSNSLIAASGQTLGTVFGYGQMQRAPDGRVYFSRSNSQTLAAITNPNLAGTSCSLVLNALTLSTGTTASIGLPNFIDENHTQVSHSVTAAATQTLVCAGATVSLLSQVTGTGAPFSYLWSNGQQTPTVAVTSNTAQVAVYTVSVAGQDGCAVSASVQVSYLPSPQISIPNVTVCPKSVVTLTASGANSYTWMPGGHTGFAYTPTINATTVFTVAGTGGNGCLGSNTVMVTVAECAGMADSRHDEDVLRNVLTDGSLEIALRSGGEVRIYSLDGKLLATQDLLAGSHTLNVSSFAPGMYLLHDGARWHRILKVE
jgi:hypothetical protein